VAGSVGGNTMIGLRMPDVDVWSERVVVALGQNPSLFTGPGTNTYLVGSGRRRILLDPGQGVPGYLDVLEQALERVGCDEIQEIVLTHGHPDHMGGVDAVHERFGAMRVSKLPWPGNDEHYGYAIEAIGDGDRIATEGATLRAIHTPGHAPDHLCFALEEEQAIFSGDNVLGVGTTVIPHESGSLRDYLESLRRLLAEPPGRIYPAHGPCIADGPAKIREYLSHREDRERQILVALEAGPASVPEIVARVYTDVPLVLHKAAELSVSSHLLKLRDEGRAQPRGADDARKAIWSLS
jgi:glyoxylase-like metal-dependent hydrolase (beta-lactamase superfamily II)